MAAPTRSMKVVEGNPMSALTDQLQMLPMHLTEVIRTDRYRALDSRSHVYICSKYDAEIHIWCFQSLLKTNPRDCIFVSYGNRPRFEPAVLVYGADETQDALEFVLAKTRDKLRVTHDASFIEQRTARMSWDAFLPTTIGMFGKLEYHEFLHIPTQPRSVETMLEYIKRLGVLFNDTAAHGISLLSRTDLIVDGMELTPMFCRTIGRLCRSGEMEGVFWEGAIFKESLKDHQIFLDSNVPAHYIPDGPQLWYLSEAITVGMDPRALAMDWWTPHWQLSAIAVVPSEYEGKLGCMSLTFFELDTADPADAYEMLPRIIMAHAATVGKPCHSTCTILLAGLEYMQEVLDKKSGIYSPGARKEATRQGKALNPYSTLVVRRIEHGEPDGTTEPAEGSGRHYHFSFFQRRHRRRLKQPRKSDGVQVIRVSACQKCKHLPLRPGAEVKITKVSR